MARRISPPVPDRTGLKHSCNFFTTKVHPKSLFLPLVQYNKNNAALFKNLFFPGQYSQFINAFHNYPDFFAIITVEKW